MTAKKELTEIIERLSPEELEIAINVFEAHFATKQAEQPPRSHSSN